MKLNDRIRAFAESRRHAPLPERERSFSAEVLIPCHNHGDYVESLLKILEHGPAPITIINDASSDDTADILARLRQRYRFKLIENTEALLQGGSLNKAIAESENNLFIVANADDIMTPGWIRYAISTFEETGISLLGGGSVPFQLPRESEVTFIEMVKSMRYVPRQLPTIHGPADAMTFDHDNSINMTMTGCAFLRSPWEFVGGFFPRERRVSMHDDRDFQMRVCCFFDVGVSPEISAFYRTDSSQGMGML